MAVTLKAIAERAGVSPMVVSAALHHTAGIRMSQEKRELIQKTAREMGYRPNLMARTLSGGASRIVGVVIDSEAPGSSFAILRYIEAEAAAKGYRIMVAEEHNSVDQVAASYRIFEQYGADGVICLAHDYPEQRRVFGDLFGGKRHMVLLERADAVECPYTEVDPAPAFREILGHWRNQGRRSGFVVLNLPQIDQQRRMRAYGEVCAELGLETRSFHPAFGRDSKEVLAEMRRCLDEFILPQEIDAVLIQNDLYGAAMLAALAERGMRCPEELALFSWDDSEFCDVLVPPLASIDNDHAAQGRRLFHMLLEEIAGEIPANATVYSRPVWRRSAGVAPENIASVQ